MIEVFKEKGTHIESMKITSQRLYEGKIGKSRKKWKRWKSWKDNGSIITSVVDLERDIKELKKFGVLLNAVTFRSLARKIEEVYYKIPAKPVSVGTDNRFIDFMRQIKSVLTTGKEQADKTQHEYYILARDFNKIAEEYGYFDYEMRSLRKKLKEKKYITTPAGDYRFTTLKRFGDKVERVIMFDLDNIKTDFK